MFSDNYVEGRIKGGKWHRVRIVDNTIIDNGNTASPEGMLTSSGTNNQVEIRGNMIVCLSTTDGRPISIPSDDVYQPDGVRVEDNTIFWFGVGAAITVEGSGASVNRNHLVFLGSTNSSIHGIVVGPALAALGGKGFSICDNVFDGSAGGGSLGTAIIFQPGAGAGVTNTGLVIARNRGTGITTGISFADGTYATLPIVDDNDFAGANTPISTGADVLYLAGGFPSALLATTAVSVIGNATLAGGSAVAYWSAAAAADTVNLPLIVRRGQRIGTLTFLHQRASGSMTFKLFRVDTTTGTRTQVGSTVTISSGTSYVTTSITINHFAQADNGYFVEWVAGGSNDRFYGVRINP